MSGEGAQVSATGLKQGRFSTGVYFRYYKYNEFKTLSKKQLDELIEWHRSQNNGGKVKK